MAIPAIDTTLGGAAANSYVTLAEARDYLELRPGGKPFLDLDDEDQQRALLFAAVLIDRELYWSRKANPLRDGNGDVIEQALQFPRTGDSTIPLKVQHAQIEQALHDVTGGYLRQLSRLAEQSLGTREITTGDGARTRFQPFHPDAFPIWRLAPQARQLLMGYMENTARLARS